MSSVVNTYNPAGRISKDVYQNISNNIEKLVEEAIEFPKKND